MTPELADLRIAVVDDNRNFRDLLRTMLRSFGVRRVDTLAAADEVVPFLSQNQVDAVFIDLVLPGTNGIRLARQIRHDRAVAKRDAPIVLVTGHASRAAVVAAVAAGIDDVLVKPVSPRTVYGHLGRLLAQPGRYVAGADGYFGPDITERRRALLTRLSADHWHPMHPARPVRAPQVAPSSAPSSAPAVQPGPAADAAAMPAAATAPAAVPGLTATVRSA